MSSKYHYQVVSWQTHKKQLKKIREQVFIQEQNVPVELEWDGLDNEAIHVLAEVQFQIQPNDTENNKEKLAIGTARIIINNKQAHIGRMAVLPEWRGLGVGTKILQNCIDLCKKQTGDKAIETINLNAQVYVTQFYQKAGFSISSDEFLDAGIPHKKMLMNLTTKLN